jgi:hypothetical protein
LPASHDRQASLFPLQFPAGEWFYGPTAWAAVFSSPANPGFQNCLGIDHLPRDTAQRYLQAATPTCVRLACIGADVDINESLTGWALYQWTSKDCDGVLAAGFYSDSEFELQVFPLGSSLQDGLVGAAATFLQSEIHAGWRLLKDNAKRYVTFHIVKLRKNNVTCHPSKRKSGRLQPRALIYLQGLKPGSFRVFTARVELVP